MRRYFALPSFFPASISGSTSPSCNEKLRHSDLCNFIKVSPFGDCSHQGFPNICNVGIFQLCRIKNKLKFGKDIECGSCWITKEHLLLRILNTSVFLRTQLIMKLLLCRISNIKINFHILWSKPNALFSFKSIDDQPSLSTYKYCIATTTSKSNSVANLLPLYLTVHQSDILFFIKHKPNSF